MLPYNTNLKQASQKLRREMTDAERRLWSRLRAKQILGVQFYRQSPSAITLSISTLLPQILSSR